MGINIVSALAMQFPAGPPVTYCYVLNNSYDLAQTPSTIQSFHTCSSPGWA